MLTLLLSTASAASTVELCHWDDWGNSVVMSVKSRAVPGHLLHGDSYPSTYWADLDGDGHGDPAGTAYTWWEGTRHEHGTPGADNYDCP